MMARWLKGRMALFSLALVSVMWLSDVGQVQAATISDMFELKAAFKEWCKGNPRFADPFTAKVSDGFTITFTRDDSSPSDLRGAINTNGVSQDIDAIPLSGKAFYSNKTQNKLEFVLRGVNPGNDSHFLTLRGQGTVDRFGHLTKVAGTVFWRETTTYTTDKKTGVQSAPEECFSSGTFGVGKNLSWVPPPPPPPAGTLTVTGAPSDVGGKFVAHGKSVGGIIPPGDPNATIGSVSWVEAISQNFTHTENVLITFSLTTGVILSAQFVSANTNNTGGGWACSEGDSGCIGGVVNKATGTATFTNMVLPTSTIGFAPPVTLNGMLKFTPF